MTLPTTLFEARRGATIPAMLTLCALLAAPPAGAQLPSFVNALGGPSQLSLDTSTPAKPQGSETLDRVIAIVNKGVVLASDLDRETRNLQDTLRNQGRAAPAAEQLRAQALERLIQQELQVQSATQNGIRIGEPMLNRAMKSIAAQNNLELSQLREALMLQGIAYDAFREQLRRQLLIQQIRQRQVANRVEVRDDEVDRLLAQIDQQDPNHEYRLSHILIEVPEAASPGVLNAARQQAEALAQQLRDGADFAALAGAHSNSATGLQGGDLGWRSGARIPTTFSTLAPRMTKGEIVGPIRSPSGFDILKLVDFRTSRPIVVEQTHARHILLRTNEVQNAAATRARLQRLRTRLLGGDDFAAIARNHSEDTASAVKGGDLGWLSPGETAPRFEAMLRSLQPGQISPPFQSQFGWHLVEVMARRQQDQTTAARRAQAKERLIRRKIEEETELWLRRLRAEAFIDVRDNAVDG